MAYREKIQRPLDAAARAVIHARVRRAFFRAAFSPIPLLDGLLLLQGCFQMVAEVCQIYNLRPDHLLTLRILAEAILSAYASARLEDGSDALAGAVNRSFEDVVPDAAGVVGTIVGKVTAAGAQGTLSAFFVYRIGFKTMRLLQPVVD
jgi:uncharacterized membrane protein YcjF (UPF0283 family)